MPEWAAKLLPYAGQPGRRENRLKFVGGYALDVAGKEGAVAIVELRFPGVDGKDETGQAKVFVPPALHDNPNGRVPLYYCAGYEMDDAQAVGVLAKGYVLSTPHAHSLNPLGRGVNLDRAILHAARALPFVDARRVFVQGGSAGGWMALMLGTDAFPLVCVMADVPPIHWGYNAAYIGEQQHLAGPPEGSDKPRMPVLLGVGIIAEQSRATYGQPFDHPTYLAVSPLARLDTLTAPTLMTFSTADMLVPIEQVADELVRPYDPSLFPAGYSSRLTDRFPGVKGRRTLLSVLSPRRRQLFVQRAPQNTPRFRPDGTFEGTAAHLDVPFSEDKTISIFVLDEGPKEPDLGHFKYAVGLDHRLFWEWAEKRGVQPDQLTMSKLQRLMKRMLGEEWIPFTVRRPDSEKELPGCQLDYPEAERADVLLGLRAFAEDDACALRLVKLYRNLPRRLKALGDKLGDGTARGAREALSNAR